MVTEFVRFDTSDPVAKYGMEFEDYIADVRDRYNEILRENPEYPYSLKEYYLHHRRVWKCHKPPMGVKGLYAFIDSPKNITLDIIPGDISEVMWAETRKFCPIDNYKLKENIILRNNNMLTCAYHYLSSDCKRIFVHKYIIGEDGDYDYSKVNWECYDPKDFTPTKDMYEVFLELK